MFIMKTFGLKCLSIWGGKQGYFALHDMHQNKLQIVKGDKGKVRNHKQNEIIQIPI